MNDAQSMIDFVTAQRWFASKTQTVIHAEVVDRAMLRETEPTLELQLVELRFETGTHETYQLVVGESLDALEDPRRVRELVHMIRAGIRVAAEQGTIEFAPAAGLAGLAPELHAARSMEIEQSNSSIMFDEELILKVFRRLSPGINPELELLRFLTEHGFPHIAQLAGWYAYTGGPFDATLGILQRFVTGGVDGWELALDKMGDGSGGVLPLLRRLGAVTGELHAVLASELDDPTFAPEQPSVEALALLTATVDEEIEQIFLDLPDDNPELDPIRGRGEEVRERLRLLTNIGGVGQVIRHHGDFHLGQTLWADGDWILLDFEGEPARPLSERRLKRSPLRDVAGMLRSFAYAASTSLIVNGVAPPDGWEEQARAEFIAGYMATVDPYLLPSGSAFQKLLAVYELEKAVYELRYELNNRPDWIGIPVAGIVRMLDAEVPG
jgi:maltokinase